MRNCLVEGLDASREEGPRNGAERLVPPSQDGARSPREHSRRTTVTARVGRLLRHAARVMRSHAAQKNTFRHSVHMRMCTPHMMMMRIHTGYVTRARRAPRIVTAPPAPRATGQVGNSIGKLLGEQRCTGAPASPTKHVQDSPDRRFSFANDGSCGSGSTLNCAVREYIT